ncbi:hypothetical protein BDW66DRAFT_153400 [Aspergillus desertorum]
MTLNRVERLQMRQRGAGTRKIKEVDFGFSLGFGPPAEESSQPVSQPTNSDLNPAPAPQSLLPNVPPLAPAPSTTEATQTRSTPSPTRTNAFAASQNQMLRTPGSARNKLPPRRSTFDIPVDDELELGRSNKRRKIESPKGNASLTGAQTTPNDASQNGTADTSIQALDQGRAIPIRTITSNQAPHPNQELAAETPSIPTIGTAENPLEAFNEGLKQPGAEKAGRQESARVNLTASSSPNSPEGRRRGKKGRPSPPQDDISNLKSIEAVGPQAVEIQFTEPPPELAEAAHAPDSLEHGLPETRDKQTRRRMPASEQPAEQPTAAKKALSKDPGSKSIEASQEQSDEHERPETQEMRTLSRTPVLSQPSRGSPRSEKPVIEDAGSGPVGAPQETEAQGFYVTGTRDKQQPRSRTLASIQPSVKPPATENITAEAAVSETVPSGTAGKGVRGRKRKNLEPLGEAAATRKDSDELSATRMEDDVAADSGVTRENPNSSEDQPNGMDKGKKRAGRPKKHAQSPPSLEQSAPGKRRWHEQERGQAETRSEQGQPDADTAGAGKGRKQRKEREPSPRQEEQAEPEPEIEEYRARKRRKGAEEQEPTQQVGRTEPDAATESVLTGEKKPRRQERSSKQEHPAPGPVVEQARAGRGRKRREKQMPAKGQEEQLEAEPEAESVRADKGKKRQDRAPTAEQEEEQDSESESEPEPEPEIEREPQPNQRPRDTKRGDKAPTAHPYEPRRGDATEDQAQSMKRKPLQPRGETVPVTVHRLANAASLGGELLESSDEDDANSPDGIFNKQTTKLPSRGGVNPADVLAQICRETLEKTLTTLKISIENEANATRRAEWTLRRKAVEAFGAELEGRLFDLSEMLDSNFMLSIKIKKAKRNMLDLRARLDRVRREREAVALRMDAVRREHAREEQAGMVRSTINHSLHNLDLALERGQNRTSTRRDESPTAGLELRLRNLARNVSSSAPGSAGGILSQIKSFNAQLEAMARRLER